MEALFSPSRRPLRVVRPGRIGYDEAVELQRAATEDVLRGGAETLFLLEHDPVYTLGRNAPSSDVLIDDARRRALGVALRESDRGGKVTYHGPGQLVGYPILRLEGARRDVKRYVTDLEEVLIRTLADFGIAAARSPRRERVTSVWVGDDKIGAIGIHLTRWVTTHGFAMNVTNEPLPFFDHIVPCGIRDGGVTSIERTIGRAPTLDAVADRILEHFSHAFDREIIAP